MCKQGTQGLNVKPASRRADPFRLFCLLWDNKEYKTFRKKSQGLFCGAADIEAGFRKIDRETTCD